MHFKTTYNEETLLESMWSLKRAMNRLERILDDERTKVGEYEGVVEQERKWNLDRPYKKS